MSGNLTFLLNYWILNSIMFTSTQYDNANFYLDIKLIHQRLYDAIANYKQSTCNSIISINRKCDVNEIILNKYSCR